MLHRILLIISYIFSFLTGFGIDDKKSVSIKKDYIENKGQIRDQEGNTRPDVKFLWEDRNSKLILKENGFSYEVFTIKPETLDEKSDNIEREKFDYISHRIDVDLVNGNFSNIQKEDISVHYKNFYYGKDAYLNVRSFSKISYKSVYPHIDLVFTIHNDQPKYDFILWPGARLDDIQIRYQGQNKINLINGEINLETSQGSIIENIPMSFHEGEKLNKQVNVQYLLQGNIVKFSCSDCLDRNDIKLTIDPVPTLLWKKFDFTNWGADFSCIDIDQDNNVFISGAFTNFGNIATTGAYQVSYGGGNRDAFVAKLDSMGNFLWGTYYGGSGSDIGLDIKIDKLNNIVICGNTESSNLSVPSAYQSSFAGGIFYDGFIAKFNSAGFLNWATYYGGNSYDEAKGIEIDAQNNIVATGMYNRVIFLAKFTPTGARLWHVSLGNEFDFSNDVAVDRYDNIIIAGVTDATGGIASSGAHQQSFGGGESDGFIRKYNSNGVLIWGTYYGGNRGDNIQKVICDNSDNIIAGGATLGIDNITSSNGFRTSGVDGSPKGFYVKFNSAGTRIWGTFYGTVDQGVFGLDSDSYNNYYFAGFSDGSNMVTPDPYYNFNYGSYMAKFDSLGQRIWGTYLYTTDLQGREEAKDLVIDHNNNILITGPYSRPITPPHANELEGSGFISKFRNCPPNFSFTISTLSSIHICEGDSISFSAPTASSYLWSNGKNSQTIHAKNPGNYYVTIKDADGCPGTSEPINLSYKAIDKNIILSDDSTICETEDVLLYSNPASSSWNWSTTETNDSIYVNSTGMYYLNATVDGCNVVDSILVIKISQENLSLGKDTSICQGELIELKHNLTGFSYQWSTGETSEYITVGSAGKYSLQVFNGNCLVAIDTINIDFNPGHSYFVPNLITPNGDFKNEKFVIGDIVQGTELTIYNRWGELIYKSLDYKNDWPNKFPESGLYYYFIRNDWKCIKEYNGWVHVVK
jgi:hypothetical protein